MQWAGSFAPANNTMATTFCLHTSPSMGLLGSAPTHRPPAHRRYQPTPAAADPAHSHLHAIAPIPDWSVDSSAPICPRFCMSTMLATQCIDAPIGLDVCPALPGACTQACGGLPA